MPNNVIIKPEQILRNREFLERYLTTNISRGNFKSGTHIHDILVNGFAYILSLFDAEVAEVRSMLSLDAVSDLYSVSPDRVADSLAYNWFITRKEGTKVQGYVTVFVSDTTTAVVPVGTKFTRIQGLDFIYSGDTAQTISGSEMEMNLDENGNIESYSFKVPVESRVPGLGGDLAPGQFESFDVFASNILRVENEHYFTKGEVSESTPSLVARAKESVTLRGFFTAKSIRATILDEIENALQVVVVGAGDTEMRRDLVLDPTDNNLTYHALGHVNVYTQLPLFINRSVTFTLAAGEDSYELGSDPLYYITRVSVAEEDLGNPGTFLAAADLSRLSLSYVADGDYQVLVDGVAEANRAVTTIGTGEYTISYADSLLGFSYNQEPSINFETLGAPAQRQVTVYYTTVKDYATVAEFIQEEDTRAIGANYESYYFYPCVVTLGLTYILRSTAPGDLPESSVKATLVSLFNSYLADSDMLRISTVVNTLLTEYSDYLAGIAYPVTATYLLQAPDGREVLYETTDKFTVEDTSLLADADNLSETDREALQISNRTVRFILDVNNITLTAGT